MADDRSTPRLTQHHRAIRAKACSVADEQIEPGAAKTDRTGEFPEYGHDALVDAGLYATHVPPRYGGPGHDALADALVMEEISRACASTSLVYSVTRLATLPIVKHGSDVVRDRYLPAVAREGAIFSFALSEPDAGSDAASITTRAKSDGTDYVINGAKRWITNATAAQFFLVFAVTDPDRADRRVSAFVVERSDAGVSVGVPEDKLGLRGSPTAEVVFSGVRVPADRLVGEPGGGLPLALEALDHSRVSIAAQAVGLGQAALDHAIEYLKSRRQFGRSLAEFQGLKFMVAGMAMKLAAARELTYAAAERSAADAPDLSFYSAAAKCFASDAAMEITTDAVQLLGGNGYLRSHPVERLMRDAKATQIYEGTNQIQQLVMARHLLS